MADNPPDELAPRRKAKLDAKCAALLQDYINAAAEKNGFPWRVTVRAKDVDRIRANLTVIPPPAGR